MNKLSELSKPVATVDVQRGRPDGNMFAVAWSSAGHALPDGPHFIYSQEYVSALLADNERIASDLVARNGEIEGLGKRVAELEAKLATPVRLPAKYNMKMAGDKSTKSMFYGHNSAINDSAKALRAAGFTVEGDEQ
ncbi:Uncharacterised protein [Serratia ficaria]|uniref:hypothetical protein n=1 Tax=Serratia ficaria TaxID=61651 RepID=UPI00217BED6E|nr:hypothetical protein [Serratia ficaria]CAI2080579.1 Uncharacterised protein [Serratia ficaria]CAI2490088.1 Uncharacterised protein [Serratia ficaria]